MRGWAACLLSASAGWALAGCASAAPPPPAIHPYRALLLPVEGAKAALAEPAGEDSIPVASTPEAMEKAITDALLGTAMFSELVPVKAPPGERLPEAALAAAAAAAKELEADLILRVQVRTARLSDLGNNSGTVWSCLLWFMVPLPIWTVDDRSYQADFRVHADLFSPEDLQRPVASFVVTAGEQTLDVWDRGLSVVLLVLPPPFVGGNEEKVSRKLTERVLGEVTRALVEEVRRSEIPSRFELKVSAEAGEIHVAAASRRRLRSVEIRIGGKPAKEWGETDLEPDETSPDRGFVYRKSLRATEGVGPRTFVRVVAEDEVGGREVRTLGLKGKP